MSRPSSPQPSEEKSRKRKPPIKDEGKQGVLANPDKARKQNLASQVLDAKTIKPDLGRYSDSEDESKEMEDESLPIRADDDAFFESEEEEEQTMRDVQNDDGTFSESEFEDEDESKKKKSQFQIKSERANRSLVRELDQRADESSVQELVLKNQILEDRLAAALAEIEKLKSEKLLAEAPVSPLFSSDSESEKTKVKQIIRSTPEEVVATRLDQKEIGHKIIGRTGTNLGSSEGDHVIASVLLKEALYSAINGKTLEETQESLKELLPAFTTSPAEVLTGMMKIVAYHKDKYGEFSKDDRREITATLRGAKMDEGKIQAGKGRLKIGQKATDAILLTALEEYTLTALNKLPDAANYRFRNPDGIHGGKEVDGICNLRVLSTVNSFLEAYHPPKSPEELAELLTGTKEKLTDDIMIYYSNGEDTAVTKAVGIICDHFGLDSDKYTEFNEDLIKTISNPSQASKNIYSEKVAKDMSELFDYGFHPSPKIKIPRVKEPKLMSDEEKLDDLSALPKQTAKLISGTFNTFNLPAWSKDKTIDDLSQIVINDPPAVKHPRALGNGQGWGKFVTDRVTGATLDKATVHEEVRNQLTADYKLQEAERKDTTFQTIVAKQRSNIAASKASGASK